MTSVNPIGPSGLVVQNGDTTATQLVNGATLDSNHQVLRTTLDALISALGVTIRSDNQLVDSAVRLRSLDPEVTALLGSGASGVVWQPKVQVALASTANLTLSGEQTIDGVVTNASRILVKDQTVQSQNGIYVTGAGAWTRASDANTAALIGYAMCYVVAGTANATTVWINTIAASLITLGTTALPFARLSANSGASISPAMLPVVGAATTPLARAALGSTATGDALFTAGTPLVARQTIGVVAAMDGVVAAASVGAARTALGGVLNSVATVAALKALATTDLVGDVIVEGYGTSGDGGGGLFRWNSGDSSADNGGTILQPSSLPATGRWNRVSPYAYVVDVRHFGAKGDGTTDDTAAIQAAANLGTGYLLQVPQGTYKITSAITLLDNTELVMVGSATIQTADATINILSATSKTGVKIRGGHLKYTAGGSTPYIGSIYFNGCSHCLVDSVEIEGAQWAGVYIYASSYNIVRGCWMLSGYGSAQDAADVCIRGNSNANLIEDNHLLGGALVDHGVLVQDADGLSTLLYNVVRGNVVETHKAYGIACYQVTARDQFTLISGNQVRDIIGTSVAGASGSGIYVQTAGGCVVSANVVKNCCTGTTSTTNGPAGISIAYDIAGSGASLRGAEVVGNQVDTANYYGILVSGAPSAVVSGNTARSTNTTNGRGIYIDRAINVAVTGNSVEIPNAAARSGIQVFTNDRNLTGIVVSGNKLTGGNDALIQLNVSGAFTITASINGNNAVGAGASAIGLLINGGLDCAVSGNYLTAPSVALSLSGCAGCRGAGNVLRSAGSVFTTAGTCSRNFFDQSNDFGSSATPINNSVAGTNVEFRNNGAPASGNWQVGDRVQQTVPVVGAPKGWLCTVAGTPGTWVSEGNL